MHKIQDLFDPSKQLDRSIESVVTFGANTEKDLSSEISEYVVTPRLHDSYERIIEDFQRGFDDGSKEIGIWVSGFYGSGKSSFAKYLGLSFNKSLIIDGVSFGERLMNRVSDSALSAMHKTIIQRHNPVVVMIDLSTEQTAGKTSFVSDIVYYETLKQLGINQSNEPKVLTFINLLKKKNRYDDFCNMVKQEFLEDWDELVENDSVAIVVASKLAPRIFPTYFPNEESFNQINSESVVNEKERFQMLYERIKECTGRDKVIFVLDEVGQYVSSDVNMILNLQGMAQIFKDLFRGNVWIIATAQQTLTEDNPNAQLNSTELYRLNDRFPEKVDIEAEDIKEIITRRLLGKSQEGKTYLKALYNKNEGVLKNNIHLTLQAKSIYNQLVDSESFANLYPFLPVHIDILMQLLQKLASRTGGVGLRSVIRLIRDILIDNHLADLTIGYIAGPDAFYDVLHSDMEKGGATRELVESADKAIKMFTGNKLAVRICKTIAVMQLLDDFNLNFDNLCALLYNKVGSLTDKLLIRDSLKEIIETEGLTLQEIEGKFQFMTSAILTIRWERKSINPREAEKAAVMQEIMKDIFNPAPSVNIYGSKTLTPSVDLCERGRIYPVHSASNLKLNVRFVQGADYEETRNQLEIESTQPANRLQMYWVCTLPKDKEALLLDIAKSKTLVNRHQNETNKEIVAFIKAQDEYIIDKTRELRSILVAAQANSEIIFRGSPQQVTADTYKTTALKGIAEKVFEKYPLANQNMKSNAVSLLAGYSDLTSLPDSLNPFKMVNKKDGSIDVAHAAFTEMKDFINRHGEPTGSEMLSAFESDPYGWSKDTTRYIVALMLKANLIQIRAAGNSYNVFGATACEVLGNNTSFNKVNIALNTTTQLTAIQLIKAATTLTSLFNSPRLNPVVDQIATEAFKKAKSHMTIVERVKATFEQLQIEGLQTVIDAQRFLTRIIDSEGGEAPALLGKDDVCANAIKYVLEFDKADKKSGIVNSLKHINKLLLDSRMLPPMSQLDCFQTYVDSAEAQFKEHLNHGEIFNIVAEVNDLKDAFDHNLEVACVKMETQSNALIAEEAKKIMDGTEYHSLTEAQKQSIDSNLANIKISCRCKDIIGLHEMASAFSSIFIPGGPMRRVESNISTMVKANQPVVTTTTTVYTPTISTPSRTSTLQTDNNGENDESTHASESTKTVTSIKMKHRFTSRAELESLINQLTQLLDKVDNNSPVDFNFSDDMQY